MFVYEIPSKLKVLWQINNLNLFKSQFQTATACTLEHVELQDRLVLHPVDY